MSGGSNFKYDGSGLGKGGTGTILVDGKSVGTARFERTLAFRLSLDETLSTTGYGVNLSGVVPAPWSRELDRLRFAWNAGEGIGRYITDLDAVGGQDAIFDPVAHELVALPVASAYVGYEHWWRPTVRSTVTVGYVWVDNLDSQPADALHRTERFSANLAWSPIPRLDLVAEFLAGRRINVDRQSGAARQLQLGGTFRF